VIRAVVDGLREAKAKRRMEVPPIAVLDDVTRHRQGVRRVALRPDRSRATAPAADACSDA
jgi:hypothetical protein